MKSIYTFIAWLFFSCSSLYAQSGFAPKGSEWYFNIANGVARSRTTGDTSILGRQCKVLKTETGVIAAMAVNGFAYNSIPDMYIYDAGDTVFLYNKLFGRFTPLYVFNVNAGDTVRLPLLPTFPGTLVSSITSTDSTFRYRVDSVKMVLYDTSLLKTIYTSSVINPLGNLIYAYQYGAYAKKMGRLDGGLIPACLSCVFTLDGKLPFLGSTRCYHDTAYTIKLVTADCNNGIALGTKEVSNTLPSFSIAPNPAAGAVQIGGGFEAGKVYDIAVNDMAGRLVYSQQVAYTQQGAVVALNLSAVTNGVYILRIEGEKGLIGQTKLLVNR